MEFSVTWCRVVQFSADWCSLVQLGGDWWNVLQTGAFLCTLVLYIIFTAEMYGNNSTSDFFKNSVLFPVKYPSSLYERFRHGSFEERFTSRTSYIEIST